MSYVDLHSHLLPGLDDGAPTIEETLRHARRLDAHGVHDVACTSHIKRADFPRIEIADLERLRAETQRAIDAEGLDVRLHPGGELAHIDALELDDRDLRADRPGPAPRARGCCSSARSRASTTRSTRPSSGSPASATGC